MSDTSFRYSWSLPKDYKLSVSIGDEINNASWTWAKTYADIAPHWYIRMMENPLLYGIMYRLIKEYGVDENYTNHLGSTYVCRYLYHKEHKYWCMPPIINRALIKQQRKEDG